MKQSAPDDDQPDVSDSIPEPDTLRGVRIGVRDASASDLDVVATILEEAALWAVMNQLTAWDAAFFADRSGEGNRSLRRDLENGALYVICCEKAPVGTFALRGRDDLVWPEAADDALYLHRFAVRSAARGAGRRAILWMTEECRRRGRTYLRLDCRADNRGICRYYTAAGFTPRGEMMIDGLRLRRYEMLLDPSQSVSPAEQLSHDAAESS